MSQKVGEKAKREGERTTRKSSLGSEPEKSSDWLISDMGSDRLVSTLKLSICGW